MPKAIDLPPGFRIVLTWNFALIELLPVFGSPRKFGPGASKDGEQLNTRLRQSLTDRAKRGREADVDRMPK